MEHFTEMLERQMRREREQQLAMAFEPSEERTLSMEPYEPLPQALPLRYEASREEVKRDGSSCEYLCQPMYPKQTNRKTEAS